MENPNHYHYVALMIVSSGTSLRAYYDYPVATHRGREATYQALVTTFTGKTCPNTSETRFADALTTSVSKPLVNTMIPCKFTFMNIHFTHQELLYW